MLILLIIIYILGLVGAANLIVSMTLGDTQPVILALIWPLLFPLAGAAFLGLALARAVRG